jgi:murein DD-endopeptidase MepM/ murein hydrolase activator NlpD
MPRRLISVIISSNYSPDSYRFSVPLWVARLAAAVAAFLTIANVAALSLGLSGALRIGRLVSLEARNRRLEAEVAQVRQLKQQLADIEQQSGRMAQMLGVDKTPPPVDWDAGAVDSGGLPDWVERTTWDPNATPALVPLGKYVVTRVLDGVHSGVDLAAQEGTPVRAAADGVVAQRGKDRTFGNFVLLRHGGGYESYYGHLQDFNVDKGDTVRIGATIGWVGNTGRSSAPHLHLEIRKDRTPVDPAELLHITAPPPDTAGSR